MQWLRVPYRHLSALIDAKPAELGFHEANTHYTARKIRVVLEGLRGEDSIAELCRREGIVPQPPGLQVRQ